MAEKYEKHSDQTDVMFEILTKVDYRLFLNRPLRMTNLERLRSDEKWRLVHKEVKRMSRGTKLGWYSHDNRM